jgi:hypothetical protein
MLQSRAMLSLPSGPLRLEKTIDALGNTVEREAELTEEKIRTSKRQIRIDLGLDNGVRVDGNSMGSCGSGDGTTNCSKMSFGYLLLCLAVMAGVGMVSVVAYVNKGVSTQEGKERHLKAAGMPTMGYQNMELSNMGGRQLR